MEMQEGEVGFKISNDEEYMRRYSAVGELYYKKLRLIRDCRHKEDDSFTKTIIDLNGEIKKAEGLFFKNIAELSAAGMEFSFEAVIKPFNLELYEKRALLFFVYLQFYLGVSSFCFEMETLSVLDLEGSLFARMRDFKYLFPTRPLMKNNLLLSCVERVGPECSSRGLWLARKACEVFSRSFSKEISVENEKSKTEAEEKETEIRSVFGEEEKEEEVKNVKDVGFFLEPRYRFEDVVLPGALRDKVMFFLKTFADPGLDQFGACDILKRGRGLVFLFYGPPGTGKSMLAEGIASFLCKKMLMAEMPKLTRKWYGETDKAIADLFRLAKEQNLVLCMNEADSFLYDRTFGVQEHDIRFVNVMLQEIERFEGVAVFTTNMDALLDPALERRVSLRVPFTLPDEKIRAEIWKKHIPQNMRLAEDVNFEHLAHTFDFSGGYIKNAVMNAARRIVLEKRDFMTKEDLLFGAQMEKDGLYNKELKKGPVGFAF